MVMQKNAMRKNLRQSILKSIGRYIAIILIIALGAGIFVGLRATKFDMVATGQKFMDETNMFDLRLLNSYGWNRDDVASVARIDGVADAEGVINMDVLGRLGDGAEDEVYSLYAIPQRVSQVYLLGGRMPQSPNECLADGSHATDEILGREFVVSQRNKEDTLDSLTCHTFTVVGYISTPLYMDISRGTTSLGDGTVASYLYIPPDAFDVDYFTEIAITIPGDYEVYTDAYTDAMAAMAEYIKPLLAPIAQQRFESVKAEALEKYNDGWMEYSDGLKEFEDGKLEADRQIREGYRELMAGQLEIEANRKALLDGEAQLKDGQKELDGQQAVLNASRQTLSDTKATTYAQLAQANSELLENYITVSTNLRQVESGLAQIDSGLAQLDSGIAQLEDGLAQLDTLLSLLDPLVTGAEEALEAAQSALDAAKEDPNVSQEALAQLEAQLQSARETLDDYLARYRELKDSQQTYSAQLRELQAQREDVLARKAELEDARQQLDDAMFEIDNGFLRLQNNQLQADNQFAAAEAQLESGQALLDAAQAELNSKRAELEVGKEELDAAEQSLSEGWAAWRRGRDTAQTELSDAQLQLSEVRADLKEAKRTLDAMEAPEVYALTRNTNVGYLALDSNSDIVEGVSAVFPAFFLLIAALVCITTMTRMVEEERTQIGTLKALGYSNFAIIRKYLSYAGSAAVIGCGLGVIVGSVIFPEILWQAYHIILNVTPEIILKVDWPLCLAVVTAYTAVTLAVTWYCCRMALREVPAELIRPKPPTTGKKIFLEHLPFWSKISFLNKVMLRNIFRYRQRLLMMLVGIGGCTALLVTGFGIRDSIVDIVSYQYEEVTLYDMEVRFAGGMDAEARQKFRDEIGRYVDRIGFAHQSSVEMDFNSQTRDVILIAADNSLEQFMDFHSGDTPIAMPGKGEALLSIGIAEKVGIRVGDTVSIRDPDMKSLTLTISGIYDNNVYNYIIVTPQTVQAQWGEAPEQQMAYITVKDTQDVHQAGTRVSGYDGVMNVSISQDLADQVGSMLDAMELIVVTVVVCAGLLAVTVLYNLTNINITERIREIATIKVLGFREGESAAYVFKENLLLSAMGAALGLGLGKLLLDFVMSQIKVDMVWFQARVLPMSYIWSIVLTMFLACLVDFLLYFKLQKINMAEALKSVE